MFQKILIANRGEIARRVIRTCKKLNIQTVAVYSEADRDALFVREADEAYEIGKPPVSLSYLNIEKIIEVAKKAKVDAIHPGYGLLSENAEFAKRCEEEGITFIGPKPEVIAAMGSKLEARVKMKEAGVPIIEGMNVAIESVEEAIKAAEEIGYPLMLKASSGGGGIGMQRIYHPEELEKAFESNKKRAESYFGDGTLYIEKCIENPHHVEVQILADVYGNVVPLFERECSIQRRNQKVIEEAPSPTLSDTTREKMLETAVQAAKYIGYTNAGTFEFLVDEKENFYFLEMNTRLQVEHPVTEAITGIDLVEQQIRIAQGLPLEINRESIKMKGHAIEARIYAEDPVTFFPSPGTITLLELPEGEGIRHDCAVESGFNVTPFYDPMIGKLICYGETREQACERLIQALKQYKVEGIKTNIPMLIKIASHEEFLRGNITTSFVEHYYLPNVQVTK
ncbi:acetyl-CoA carboxylase biotin carboxylase subunit [Ureibacillus thermophilus]|uniref:biotin carboxylase n=1 Tax=Ureibacillus thermophilus TaxID=367743 RepID=A0A4V1A347_9BACL|nr:acetyl-CoA carboxylase biotin carboxylase subunit [Ureibacillus thermophilus]QBK25990.1 acetyl-CoA carboxylase biotin carboxylase subunit [Ureibacillus thermophilus]